MNFKRYLLVLYLSSPSLFSQTQNPITLAIESSNPSENHIKDLLFKNIYIEYQALSIAIKRGYTNIVRILLNKYSNINKQDDDGNTLLMQAIQNNNLEIVKLLLQAGADVNIKDNQNLTALIIAIALPISSLGKIKGNIKLVRTLIDYGANVNYNYRLSEKTMTPLSLAIEMYKTFSKTDDSLIEIVQLLLKHGAIPTISNIKNCKNTPLENYILQEYARRYLDVPNEYKNEGSYWSNINIAKFFDQNEHSLKTSILKKIYQEYLQGETMALEYLLSSTNTPVTIQEYFTPTFIEKIKKNKSSNMINFSKNPNNQLKTFLDRLLQIF